MFHSKRGRKSTLTQLCHFAKWIAARNQNKLDLRFTKQKKQYKMSWQRAIIIITGRKNSKNPDFEVSCETGREKKKKKKKKKSLSTKKSSLVF